MHYIIVNDKLQCKLKLQDLADCHYDLTDLMIMFQPHRNITF